MKKKTVKEVRKDQKLILYSETLRVLNSTKLQVIAGGSFSQPACCGSLECWHD